MVSTTDDASKASTPSTPERVLWAAALLVVVVLAVPWFLWRSSAVAFGLPTWIWWHVGWMVLASVVFYAFARRAWGLGVEP